MYMYNIYYVSVGIASLARVYAATSAASSSRSLHPAARRASLSAMLTHSAVTTSGGNFTTITKWLFKRRNDRHQPP